MSGRRFDWRAMPEYRFASICALVFLYAPLAVLIVYSFNANREALIWSGVTTHWFAKALGNPDLRRAAINSLIVAATATPVASLLSVPAAVAFERGGPFRGRALGEALIAMPLIAPEIVTAIATLVFFDVIGLRAGLGNVILAHVAFCIPFALMPVRARLRGMPRDIEDAAHDLYAGRWQVFRLVT
ncbi:MAG: ABC transporter permease, partial [Beijerinckiaceae bacterium]|nr:ABC transporter permease [Beijerinckiaceae bacterium]